MRLGLKLMRAVEQTLLAKISKIEANLEICLEHPVGIGEHVDMIEEISLMINEISEAEGALNTVRQKILRFK